MIDFLVTFLNGFHKKTKNKTVFLYTHSLPFAQT